MKKKITVLGALLLAVVVTGYSVSGTYAKYVQSADMGSDTANVAKFKVTNGTNTWSLFNTLAYDKEADANNGGKVLKPGAIYHQDLSFNFGVTSEVATTTTYAIGGTDTVVNGSYAPMRYALVESTVSADAVTEWYTFDGLKELVAGKEESSEGAGDGKAAMTFASDKTYRLYVKWSQNPADFAEGTDIDAEDTKLGNNMVDGSTYNVNITMSATVTQDVDRN